MDLGAEPPCIKRKHVKGAIFLTLGIFQFSKRKSLIDHGDSNNINNKHQFYRLAKHQLGMCFTRSHLIRLFKKRDARAFFLILTRALERLAGLKKPAGALKRSYPLRGSAVMRSRTGTSSPFRSRSAVRARKMAPSS